MTVVYNIYCIHIISMNNLFGAHDHRYKTNKSQDITLHKRRRVGCGGKIMQPYTQQYTYLKIYINKVL